MMRQVFILLALIGGSFQVSGQYAINGKITDELSNPMVGVNVIIPKLISSGTVTGIDGTFILQNITPGMHDLQFSYMGFETKNIKLRIPNEGVLHIQLSPTSIVADEVIVSGTRATQKYPITYSNLSRETIEENNNARDIPSLLNSMQSMVYTSDAGAGIGYSFFRIRGTDLTRINVMVNGIPLNDAESHGVFWVNMPDFATSTENIQVQRGVGTSSNGAAAFGASVNLQTLKMNPESYSNFSTAAGSYNTFKNSVSVGSGLIDEKFTFDARLSKINSNGYIERATSDLKSFFFSAGYFEGKNMLKFNVFSGHEITGQAWDGVPGEILPVNRRYNGLGAYTNSEGELKYYENQVDDYQQSHFQLLYSRRMNEFLNLNAAVHYTRGKGFYEEYKENGKLTDYLMKPIFVGNDTMVIHENKLEPDNVKDGYLTSTDLIRRKWLDNHFYGVTFSANYTKNKLTTTFGGGWNQYDGNHYGSIIWARFMSTSERNHRWYTGTGFKTDYNLYLRSNYELFEGVYAYGDLQYRHINYKIEGTDDDLRTITQKPHIFDFFNPKLGITWMPTTTQKIYLSWAVANREPNRNNYVDWTPPNPPPVYETLYDYEAGYQLQDGSLNVTTTLYYMDYQNQLVLTGKLNDVGSGIMVNVPNSYRAGIEIASEYTFLQDLHVEANITLSQNKIAGFTEYIDNSDYWLDVDNEKLQYINELVNTDIAFSPNIIAGGRISYPIIPSVAISWSAKYVGEQFIDNTSSNERKLNDYLVNDVKISFSPKIKFVEKMRISLDIFNVLNKKYISNAWVYQYYYEDEHYNAFGYYPQATRNFMISASFDF